MGLSVLAVLTVDHGNLLHVQDDATELELAAVEEGLSALDQQITEAALKYAT